MARRILCAQTFNDHGGTSDKDAKVDIHILAGTAFTTSATCPTRDMPLQEINAAKGKTSMQKALCSSTKFLCNHC